MLHSIVFFALLTGQNIQSADHGAEWYILEGDEELVFIDANGRDGKSSRDAFFFGSTPDSGTSGSSGGHVTLIVRDLPQRVIIEARGGRGGDGGDGARGKYGQRGEDGRNAGLFKKAKAGEPGQDGGNGGDGSHGGHGGKGGHIRIIYLMSENYDARWRERFEVDVAGGLGGAAGDGGLGGEGGEGGRGGRKFWSSKREDDGQRGLDGQRGRRGVDGSAGEEGRVEFIEVEDLRDFLAEDMDLRN